MSVTIEPYVFAEAIRLFRQVRERQSGAQTTRGASDQGNRDRLFCRRLVLERHYSGACLLITDRSLSEQQNSYTGPDPDLSADAFLSQLLRHVSMH